MTAEQFTCQLQLQCPCGGVAMVGESGGPSGTTPNTPTIIHTMPMCQQFETLAPDEYLRWLRMQLEGRGDA